MLLWLILGHFGVGLATAALGLLIAIARISEAEFGFGLVMLLVGVLSLGTGYGLLNALKWVRWTARISGVLYIAVGLLLCFTGNVVLLLLGVLEILLGLVSALAWNLSWTKDLVPK